MHYELTLPNAIQCADGYWTKRVVIDELIGEDEDIITDRARKSDGSGELLVSGPERITNILSRITVMVGNERRPGAKDRFSMPDYFRPLWEKAFSQDRVFTMIMARKYTQGPIHRFPAEMLKLQERAPPDESGP